MKKTLCAVLVLVMLFTTACNKDKGGDPSAETVPIVEVENNDYNGAVTRLQRMIADAHSRIDSYTESAKSVMEQNPTDYWNVEDFFHINLEFPDMTALEHTEYFNERTAWTETMQLVTNTFVDAEGKVTVSDLKLTRNFENDYSMYYNGRFDSPRGNIFAEVFRECLYDAGHDWMRSYVFQSVFNANERYLDYALEYARYGNVFVVQTQNERLALEYRDNVLVTFYYSKLNPKKDRAIYHPYHYVEGMAEDENGELVGTGEKVVEYLEADTELKNLNQYSEEETIFKRFSAGCDIETAKAWVFEEPTDVITVSFENGNLSVAKINELSGALETFMVTATGKVTKTETVEDENVVFGVEITEEEEGTDPLAEDNEPLAEGDTLPGEEDGTVTQNTE